MNLKAKKIAEMRSLAIEIARISISGDDAESALKRIDLAETIMETAIKASNKRATS